MIGLDYFQTCQHFQTSRHTYFIHLDWRHNVSSMLRKESYVLCSSCRMVYILYIYICSCVSDTEWCQEFHGTLSMCVCVRVCVCLCVHMLNPFLETLIIVAKGWTLLESNSRWHSQPGLSQLDDDVTAAFFVTVKVTWIPASSHLWTQTVTELQNKQGDLSSLSVGSLHVLPMLTTTVPANCFLTLTTVSSSLNQWYFRL